MMMVMTKDSGLAICFYGTYIGYYPGVLQDLWYAPGTPMREKQIKRW